MPRTLADLALSDAPLDARLAAVRSLAAAVRDLHARGRIHGALGPAAVAVLEGGAVVLAPPDPGAPAPPLERAGFVAPEVARGGRPSSRSDAFSLGALAYLALTGRGPFDAGDALETMRRTLYEEPAPARLREPSVPAAVEAEIAALLAKRARRRTTPEALLAAVGGGGREATAAVPGAADPEAAKPRATASPA